MVFQNAYIFKQSNIEYEYVPIYSYLIRVDVCCKYSPLKVSSLKMKETEILKRILYIENIC